MATNLLDAIRNSQSSQAPGMTDGSARVSQLLRAKSGKTVGGGDVGASSLAEQAAVGNAQQQMQNEVAPQQELQNQGLQAQAAQQEQSTQLQKADINQQRKAASLDTKLKTEALLNQFEQNQGQLDLDKNKAQVNQFAQGLRLQNQQYIDSLQREGKKARLDSDIGFNEALSDETFGDAQDLFKKQLGNKEILDANDRDFSRAMGQMTIDQARYVFDSEKKAAAARGTYEAIGNVTQGGVAAYGAYSNSPSSKSASSSTASSGTPGSNASDYTSLPD